MDYGEESSFMNNSRMAPPSQLPRPHSPGKSLGLSAITESQGNARSNTQSMLPPPPSLKHKLGPYNEPEPKRKTLAERAGEPRSIATATPGPRANVKPQSLVGAGKTHSRNTSFSSSVASRTPSVSSRNTSGGSFSSSVGQGRPLSSYGRTQNGYAHSSTARPNSALPKPRPATSMELHDSEEDYPEGKRKGTEPITSVPSSVQFSDGSLGIQNRKLRQQTSTRALRSSKTMGNLRDIRETSVSTMLNNFHLNEAVTSRDSYDCQGYSSTREQSPRKALRHTASISTGLRNMRLDSSQHATQYPKAVEEAGDSSAAPKTPCHIPVLSKLEAPPTPTPSARRTPRPSPQKQQYLTKDSNIVNSFTGWDVESRFEGVDAQYRQLKNFVESTTGNQDVIAEVLAVFKSRVAEMEDAKTQFHSSNRMLQSDLDVMKQQVETLQQKLLTADNTFDDQIRAYRLEMDDASRENRNQVEKLRRDNADEIDRLLRLHRNELREAERKGISELEERIRDLERRNDLKLEEERARRLREVQDLEGKLASESTSLDLELQKKDREIQNLQGELEDVRGEVNREQTLKNNALEEVTQLKQSQQKIGSETSTTISSLEATVASLRARIHFLESGSKAQSDSFADMESRLQDAVRSAEESKKKLIKEETLRRILFNQVQELKGNIRVMARIRPVAKDAEGDVAKLTYPDLDKESKELEILGKEEKSSLGTITRKPHAFTFDRVFGPESQNEDVFGEISQLVQSALDGYNVCIFCYGQTGSGKTHTMSSADGMIPRATHQIYETATNLKEKGWEYTMEGSFVEVYNEDIHDLLGSSKDFDKKKHEIRHDEAKKQTTVTGLMTVPLDSEDTVETILKRAANNRSVAATKSNERSSRSHSVFILKLVGRNSTTGEISEGTLNLVDLAGSERLKQSGAEGDRMKETQNINKSLSCLGDVIGALGQGREGAHIPYRNSKLTYLLQYSLGGNSKTLMFVMASPLEAHLSETLTSLKFATKVHNTHIGTAKKTKKTTTIDRNGD